MNVRQLFLIVFLPLWSTVQLPPIYIIFILSHNLLARVVSAYLAIKKLEFLEEKKNLFSGADYMIPIHSHPEWN